MAYSYSGADQTFTLPDSAYPAAVQVKAWGAGGGGTNYAVNNGGGGGYAQGVIDMTADRTATVIVGQGGTPASYSNGQHPESKDATYGGGGPSGAPLSADPGDSYYFGASGGGRSAVRVAVPGSTSTADEIITAGGGGGSSDGTSGVREQGGPGGPSGGDGTCLGGSNVARSGVCHAGAGGGATPTAGGTPGVHVLPSVTPYVAPTAGSQFQGGTSGCGQQNSANDNECGGGGGGGYFGGAGGDYNTDVVDAPGGGGSGHLDPVVLDGVQSGATGALPDVTAAAQLQYVAGIGVGHQTNGSNGNAPPGGNGLVVFEYNSLPTVKIVQTSRGGTGGFTFTGTNGFADDTLSTVSPDTPVAGAVHRLTAPATATSVAAGPAAGFVLTSAVCTGLGPGGTATVAGDVVILDAAAVALNADIVCDFDSGAVPTSVPAAPTIGAATPGTGKVSVAFTAPTNTGGLPITGYTATSQPGNHTGTCTASPCVVTGLSNGTGYTFTVHATNGNGSSVESSPTARATPADVPGAPTAVAATAAAGKVAVAFTAPIATGGAAVTGYTVTSTPGAVTATCTASPCTVAGLSNGTGYTFTVHATNSAGDSAESTPTEVVTPLPPPPAPDKPTATAGTSAVTVTWAADPAANVTGYTVTATPGPATCTTEATTCVLGAVAGTTYTFTVTAESASGSSPASTPSDPVAAIAPTAPAAVPATSLTLTTDKGNITTTRPGADIIVIGTGFAAHSTATITIYSTPLNLGTVVTDANGDFSKPVTVPAVLAAGTHDIIAVGAAPDGTSRAMRLTVAVAASTGPTGGGSLPVTGQSAAWQATYGLLILATGLFLHRAGRHPHLRHPFGPAIPCPSSGREWLAWLSRGAWPPRRR